MFVPRSVDRDIAGASSCAATAMQKYYQFSSSLLLCVRNIITPAM